MKAAMRSWVMFAVTCAAHICAHASAAPCPRAFLYGPDPALVADLDGRLGPEAGSPKGCTPVTVQIIDEEDGLHLVRIVDGLRIERVVKGKDTAATLITSWTRAGAGALWLPFDELGPGAPRLSSTSTTRVRPIRPTRRPFGLTRSRDPARSSRAVARKTRSSRGYLAASVLGAAGHAGFGSPGLEVAWSQRIGAWRLGPVLDTLYARHPESRERSGAHGYEIGLGLRLGRWFGDDERGIRPEAAATFAVTHVVPTQFIGRLNCTDDTCSDATMPLDPSPAFQSVTIWFDLGAAGEWWLSDRLGLGAGASFGFNTGQSAPDVELSRVNIDANRQGPLLPRWRGAVRLSVLWAAP